MGDQIVCQYCRCIVTDEASRTVLDDSGSLAITAWTCSRCGGIIEEIRILANDGRAQQPPVRYALAPSHASGPGHFAHRGGTESV